MKKYIISALAIILLIGLVVYGFSVSKDSSENTYKNTKFNYQFSIPDGWHILNEAEEKGTVMFTNSNSENATGTPSIRPDKIAVSLTPADMKNISEVNSSEHTVKKITTENGYSGFIRIDNTAQSKATVVYLSFESDKRVNVNGNERKIYGITFVLPGKIDEELVMAMANSFKVK